MTLYEKIERCRDDFEFWCENCCTIKDKVTGNDIPFRLNAPQKRVAALLEEDRRAGRPMRLIMLKARQWGGSTLIQSYMAWLQLCHCRNWHSIICSQVKDTSATIRGMYAKLLDNYPHELWEDSEHLPKFVPFERSMNTREIAGRGCRVTISSIENQDSVRGADYSMAHLSEVAFWRATPTHTPEDMVRAVCGSVAMAPNTLIVMESTANGVGNYFHSEWLRSKQGLSDKRPIFVPWYEIEMYRLPVDDLQELISTLSPYEMMLRNVHKCDWEQINWYRHKLREYPSQRQMMAEFPTTDIEAFVNSGTGLFGREHVEALRRGCHEPVAVGEIVEDGEISVDPTLTLEEKLRKRFVEDVKLKFVEDSAGRLKVWKHPSPRADYVVAVDIGGLTDRADWSVAAVLRVDREVPEVVAQWRGHIDHDLLGKTACNLARYYNEALLAIESNSLEHSGISDYVLSIAQDYGRLYVRNSNRAGFHTNRATKEMVITGLMAAVRDGKYIERDSAACDEMLTFEQGSDGHYGAKPGAHDDILMTRAIALHIASTLPPACLLPEPPSTAERRMLSQEFRPRGAGLR